jgi:hypothetical protein
MLTSPGLVSSVSPSNISIRRRYSAPTMSKPTTTRTGTIAAGGETSTNSAATDHTSAPIATGSSKRPRSARALLRSRSALARRVQRRGSAEVTVKNQRNTLRHQPKLKCQAALAVTRFTGPCGRCTSYRRSRAPKRRAEFARRGQQMARCELSTWCCGPARQSLSSRTVYQLLNDRREGSASPLRLALLRRPRSRADSAGGLNFLGTPASSLSPYRLSSHRALP